VTRPPKDKDSNAEPTVRAGRHKRTGEWPPHAEPGPGRSFDGGSEGLVHAMPGIGAIPVPERAQARRVVRLVSITGDTDLSIELQPGVNKVGRQRNDNHIVLVGPEISRFHSEIHVETERIYVRDLGSANGTYVNETRIQEVRDLQAGDRLRFSEQFKFQLLIDITVQTPDSMTLAQSHHEEPLPLTQPPQSTGEAVPASLRRRSQQLDLVDAPPETLASPETLAPEPEEPAVTSTLDGFSPMGEMPAPAPLAPELAPRFERVPALASLADQALMERVSQAVDIGTGASPEQMELAILERERRQLAVLYQVSKRCMAAESLADLDRLLINVLERIVSFDRGFISYQLPTGDWKLVMSPKGDKWERKVVRSLLQRSLKSKTPVLVPDSRTDDSLGAPVPGRTDSRLLLPLVARSAAIGTIFLISTRTDSFDDHAVDFLSLFTDIAALSVVNSARMEGRG